jgi:HK97 family phage major capsid protein
MALKVLMLRKKLNDAKKQLETLRAKDADFEKREAELEASIEEAATDEEKAAVEAEISAYESEAAAHSEEKGKLEKAVSDLEEELAEEERAQNTDPKTPEGIPGEEERRGGHGSMRHKFFGMTAQERDAFLARKDVKTMLENVRTAIREKRAINNAGLLIPNVMLGLIRENIITFSKLYAHVFVRPVPGTGRVVVEGQIPEAVWTEACATLNELNLSFSQVEVDGYKVGGYFRLCNAILEDSDIDLAAELVETLGQAIGYALDKAILFGTGTKMPVGVLTALEAVSETQNIITHAASVTGLDLAKAIVIDSGKAKSTYSRGEKTWIMNETTYTTLMAQFMEVNANGAIVSAVNGVMPVAGGVIEVLNFIPDNVIIGGYFDLYLLAERAGTTIGTSEHAFWIEDQTGFKGTARYDGKVLDANAFVAIGINGVTPAADDVTFAQDTANTEASGGEG